MTDTILTVRDTPLTRRERRDPYELHRTLERALAGTGKFLWRTDGETIAVRHGAGEAFDWLGALPGGYLAGILNTPVRTTFTGQRLFRLRANATKLEGATRNRRNLVSTPALADWMARKGEQGGFIVHDLLIDRRRRPHMRGSSKGIIVVAQDLSGVLEVTDETLFAGAMTQGIGRAKAFGCGLMLVS